MSQSGDDKSGAVSPQSSSDRGEDLPPNMRDIPWYHYSIDRRSAESLLASSGLDGSYLLRAHNSFPGRYVLSVRVKESFFMHVIINWNGQEFIFETHKFPTVRDLIWYMYSDPILLLDEPGETPVQLKFPIFRFKPVSHGQARIHNDMGEGDETIIAMKYGYLWLDQNMRNMRYWFVMLKNKLQFFKNKGSESAVGTINFSDMLDVIPDVLQGTGNRCLRIITAQQSYILHAESVLEAKEWIEILRRKMDSERRHRVCQKVIKARAFVEICVLIFNYLGLPRSGKTSFRRRIMGEIVNILQAGEIEQPSTGVVEDGGQVMLLSKSEVGAITSSKVWTVFKDGDEANMLSQLFHQVAVKSPKNANSFIAQTATKDPSGSNEFSSITSSVSSLTSSNDETPPAETPPVTVDASKSEDKEMLSILSDTLESENWEELKYFLDDITLITTNDAGGHAEFLDLHAALIHGPSFNLFFSRLPDQLEKVFEISYTNKKGESTSEGNSTVTVEEVLFQALASVACFGSPRETDETISEKWKDFTGDCMSKVMLVCTHLDLIEDEKEREKVFKEKDEIIRKKIESTEFYQNRVIEFVSRDQLMIKANNFSGDEVEIENIRDILMRVISRSFNHKINIPASWLLLSLYLRKEFAIATLEECQKVASLLRIDPEDLQDALWFLHHCVGALLYYPEVEAMRDIVICKRQVVFDSASKLIRDTFTVDKVGHCRWREFLERGQFFEKDIKNAVKEAAIEAGSDSLIPLDKLVSLFKHRNILTPISAPSEGEITYFMPCVLHTASKEQLKVLQGKNDPPPLMLCYDCGYMPLGIFPAIITNLVSQRSDDWVLIEEDIYKNKVQFQVGSDFDEVTLLSHPRYFEIAIARAEPFKVPTDRFCAYVRDVFVSTLDEVTSNMNYHFNMKYSLAFECPKHSKREHLCIVAKGNRKMLCLENPKRPKPLPLQDSHKVWFSSVDQGTAVKDVSEYPSSSMESCIPNMETSGATPGSSCTLSSHDFSKITKYIGDLNNQEITNIGVKLGLRYVRLRKMNSESLTNDMVQAWLRKDDDVGEMSGDPSWKSLCTALKECGHNGIVSAIQRKEIAKS